VVTTFGVNSEFLRWRAEHPTGFIVNHEHQTSPRYLVLYHASCPQFKDDGDFTRSYSKTCSDSISELRDWAADHARSSELEPCKRCSQPA
jgi:hypothetical protein